MTREQDVIYGITKLQTCYNKGTNKYGLAVLSTPQTSHKGVSFVDLHDTPSWAARFWSKVDTSGDCWLWTAGVGTQGHGRILVDGKVRSAHRVAYELTYGSIPDGCFVCHNCLNPLCVNPSHLLIETPTGSQHKVARRRRAISESRIRQSCVHCGCEFETLRHYVERGQMKYCSNKCRTAASRTNPTIEFNGEVYTRHSSGYYVRTEHGASIRLHRVIWETHNGPIPDGYLIHHIDHNKDNNDISNLELMEWGKHSTYHGALRPRTRKLKPICSDPDCDRPMVARGLCTKHYERIYRNRGKKASNAK